MASLIPATRGGPEVTGESCLTGAEAGESQGKKRGAWQTSKGTSSCAPGHAARPWGTLRFSSLFWSLRRSSSLITGCLHRQRAEPRGVTGRSEGSKGPVRMKQDSAPWSPRDWGQSEDGQNLCVSSPVRSGDPGPLPSLSLPKML